MLHRKTVSARAERRRAGDDRDPVVPVAASVPERPAGLRAAAVLAADPLDADPGLAAGSGAEAPLRHRAGSSPIRLVLRGHLVPAEPGAAQGQADRDVPSARVLRPELSLLAERANGTRTDFGAVALR